MQRSRGAAFVIAVAAVALVAAAALTTNVVHWQPVRAL